jgi:Protein of unknown function (DUF1353)
MMTAQVQFLSELELTNDTRSDRDWRVVADFTCRVNGRDVVVPKGFGTDLASTPQFAWSLFPPFGRWDEAATLHDYFYRIGGALSRREADEAFYAGCIQCGVPDWRAEIMFLAVRAFGWLYYKPGG